MGMRSLSYGLLLCCLGCNAHDAWQTFTLLNLLAHDGQVGQVILTEPYQFARTGVIAATCLYVGANLLSEFTLKRLHGAEQCMSELHFCL